MKKHLHFTDEGLVLKKSSIRDADKRVVILTKHHGKQTLTAFGVKKLNSKRLSHLETGSVIKLSWRVEGEFQTLEETDLLFAHSRVKESADLLDVMYLILHIINKLLPDTEPHQEAYRLTLTYLKKLHTGDISHNLATEFLSELLIAEGFVSPEEVKTTHFDPFAFVEGLIGERLDKAM